MSLIDRFVDAFDQVPRDESLGRIRLVPQGKELPEATIERLHSDQRLTGRDRQELRQWAKAHGYHPDLLAEEKHLRMVEDCDYLNHRPISEHWEVECSDEDVTVPDTVGEWHRANNSDYRIPVQWRHNRDDVQVHGMYGEWTVQASGESIAADVPAADAVDTATEYMTSDSSPPGDIGQARNRVEAAAEQYSQSRRDQNGGRKAYYDLEEVLSAYQNAEEDDTPSDWVNAFPREIGDWNRRSPLMLDSGLTLKYRNHHERQTERVCIYQHGGTFVCRIKGEWPRRPVTDWDLVFQRDDVTAAANTLSQYLQHEVELAHDYDPDPDQVWPREDMFTADQP